MVNHNISTGTGLVIWRSVWKRPVPLEGGAIMKNKIIVLILFLSFLLMGLYIPPLSILAVEDVEEQYPTVGRKKSVEEDILKDIIPTLIRKKIGKLKVDISASVTGGYDANVNLDRYDEDGSIFMQESVAIYGKYPISNIFTLRGGYDLTSIKYFKFSEPDLLDNILTVGIDTKIADNFLWSVDYMADFVGFPHDKFSEYTLNQIETSLRHDITDWLYQKIGYQFFYKHYPKWKIRNNLGSFRLGDREDTRNTVVHQLGLYIGDKTFLKTENKLYYNDSNEAYLDYYDYRALKTKATVTHLITDKLYGSANFAYQYKAYNKRGVSDNVFDQRDHLFIYGGSVFYDVIPSVSVGVSYDFRKNYSNENVQRYEDHIISSGIYCAF